MDAHKRGVEVQVVLDKSQRTEKYSSADFLVNMGIPVRIDARHAIAHNKVMVIDGQTVITGSFNFTKAGRDQQCREPAGDPLAGTGGEVRGQLEGSCRPFRSLRRYGTEGYSQSHRAESADPVAPATNPAAAGYVASRNSQVFHRADCKSAARISEKNLVRYNTRDEAIQAGKRPCGECKP